MRNQCGGLFSGAEPVREVRKSVESCFTPFVFHVFGSLVRNQCVTSAGITQQCGTSAEPVRSESCVDIGGYLWWAWVVGGGRWVVGAGCWVLGAGCWVLGTRY